MPMGDIPTWQLLVIPCVAAVIGWLTNWLAVWMTFNPLRFVGMPPLLGWQGILPAKSEKMARIVSQRALEKLGSLHEYMDRIDQEEIGRLITMLSRDEAHDAVDQVMSLQDSPQWDSLPDEMRLMIYARVQARLPDALSGFMEYATRNAEELVSLEELSVDCVRRDLTLVNRIFQRAGAVEFRFIIRSGFWVGLLLGTLQSLTWAWHPAWWVLPGGGFLIGYLTNWIALNVIFRPLNPVQVGPFRLQGIFLRRQKAVASAWAETVAREVLTLPNILRAMTAETADPKVRARLQAEIHRRITDTLIESDRAVIEAYLKIENLDRLAEQAALHTMTAVTRMLEDPQLSKAGNKEVEQLIRERMCEMSPEEFQEVLRPAFQEEEIKLILLGAALGMLAGFAQLSVF